MQICVQDLFGIKFSRNLRYDTVSTYDTLIPSLFINKLSYQYFCGPYLYDTSSDTSTMANISIKLSTLISDRRKCFVCQKVDTPNKGQIFVSTFIYEV
jgi:hypothetical protein